MRHRLDQKGAKVRFQLRHPRLLILLAWACLSVVAFTASGVTAHAAESPEQQDFFERRIRPVLAERCYRCHSAEEASPKGGLRLDVADGIRRGGDSGAAVVPGKPADSLLIAAVRYESYEMPPDGKLPDEVVADFVQWIASGAYDPRTEPVSVPPARAATASPEGHWAFQRPVRTEPPVVRDSGWGRTEIDRFVLSRLEQQGCSPSQQAEPRVLLRRVSYDLSGLPPNADEADRFAETGGTDYEIVVDRLLASPHFGERWGRYWLDVARYADTKGYVFQEDRNYPQAYTYRDWVIQAFNDDLPYDRFVTAQLAADQLEDAACAPAMGFLTLGRRFINNKHDIIDDRIDVVARGLMGLTVTCARCHDHKYDPISMADYYGLYGVFDSSREPGDAAAPLLLVDEQQPREPVVFLRGNPSNRGPRVSRQFLACLSPDGPKPFQQGSGRREMAAAIVSPDNPLTARVWVNRVWLHLFGQGLVNTPSDFGSRSDPPVHRELLDNLACRFMQEGWSTKRLIREIVTSSVYRQASVFRPECAARDPENRLWWRTNRRRLDLESLRDSLLLAAGRLDTTMRGPSVPLTEPPFATRRSVYGFIERQNLPGFFRSFDFAGPDTHCPARPYTTVPQQALFLMNSPFVLEQAQQLSARNGSSPGGDDEQRITALFRQSLGRGPAGEEVAACCAYVRGQDPPGSEPMSTPLDRWQRLAQALLMCNEFCFVD